MESSEQLDPILAEAKRLHFSDGTIKILPLSSGHWAIYGLGHEPIVILDSLDAKRIREISLHCAEYGRTQKARFIRDPKRFHREPTTLRQARETFEALDL